MKVNVRYAVVFVGATIAGVYLHEIGHAVAGWSQGIATVPTPAKEYILQSQVAWNQEIWISLGGPVGTTLAVVGAMVYFLRARRPEAEGTIYETKGFSSIPADAGARGDWLASLRRDRFRAGHEDHTN